MIKKTVHQLDDLTLLYVDVNGIFSFTILPTQLKDKATTDKFDLEYIKRTGYTHVMNRPMVQLSLQGDVGEKEFFAGNCMQNASSCYEFKYVDQKKTQDENCTEIVTNFDNGKGQVFEHHVKKYKGVNVIECFNTLINNGEEITIEMISSFSISGLSPFCDENDVDNINVYKLRSNWSSEAKLETYTAADLQMEDSWSSYGIRQERIGSVGSMPVRGHMPFYAVEDKNAHCVWAVSMEAPMSWQMDAIHHQTSISLTGGIADYNFGHWRKKLQKGERYTTYSGFLTAVVGDIELACATLQQIYSHRLSVPKLEEELPVLYNEYLYSWGNPSFKTLQPIIDETARLGVKEFVMDVGWWRPDERSWYTLGDWNESKVLFPNGLCELSDYIQSKGMFAGIWFEFEGASVDSNLFNEHRDYFLTQDGYTVQHRERVLLDFRKEEVRNYAYNKVIKLLKENHFRYIKVDYNETTGIGVDGAESYGEALRQHIECVIAFFKKIKEEVQDVVIEICSSGGHRLEPLFLSLGSQASFSDAHLGYEGAIIACDLHRWMLPRQMQIWAAVLKEYSLARIYYTLVKGMLGRLCLSGNVFELDDVQRKTVTAGIEFYNKIKHIVKDGQTLINKNDGVTGLRALKGARYIVRFSEDKKQAVLYLFAFNKQMYSVRESVFADYEIADVFFNGSVVQKADEIIFVQEQKDEVLGACVILERR